MQCIPPKHNAEGRSSLTKSAAAEPILVEANRTLNWRPQAPNELHLPSSVARPKPPIPLPLANNSRSRARPARALMRACKPPLAISAKAPTAMRWLLLQYQPPPPPLARSLWHKVTHDTLRMPLDSACCAAEPPEVATFPGQSTRRPSVAALRLIRCFGRRRRPYPTLSMSLFQASIGNDQARRPHEKSINDSLALNTRRRRMYQAKCGCSVRP